MSFQGKCGQRGSHAVIPYAKGIGVEQINIPKDPVCEQHILILQIGRIGIGIHFDGQIIFAAPDMRADVEFCRDTASFGKSDKFPVHIYAKCIVYAAEMQDGAGGGGCDPKFLFVIPDRIFAAHIRRAKRDRSADVWVGAHAIPAVLPHRRHVDLIPGGQVHIFLVKVYDFVACAILKFVCTVKRLQHLRRFLVPVIHFSFRGREQHRPRRESIAMQNGLVLYPRSCIDVRYLVHV